MMRNLEANKRELFYQNFLGEMDETDKDGNLTGNKIPVYTDKTRILGNILVETAHNSFGTKTGVTPHGIAPYFRAAVALDEDYGLDECSRLFIDGHEYMVKLVYKTVNQIMVYAE